MDNAELLPFAFVGGEGRSHFDLSSRCVCGKGECGEEMVPTSELMDVEGRSCSVKVLRGFLFHALSVSGRENV